MRAAGSRQISSEELAFFDDEAAAAAPPPEPEAPPAPPELAFATKFAHAQYILEEAAAEAVEARPQTLEELEHGLTPPGLEREADRGGHWRGQLLNAGRGAVPRRASRRDASSTGVET